jgi:hypothetical protein
MMAGDMNLDAWKEAWHKRRRVRDKCRLCGFPEHMAIHMPVYGAPPHSKPWGHCFESNTPDAVNEEPPCR